MNISNELRLLGKEAENKLSDIFYDIDDISRTCTECVLDVFREERVSEAMFAPSTGYGYGDAGRDAVDRITAKIFGGEAGFMRTSIVSGTHAITIGLFGLLRPGDTMLSITGTPYDTLHSVIGLEGKPGDGSLIDFGVTYDEADFTADEKFDFPTIGERIDRIGDSLKIVYLQRSKGYAHRPTLTFAEIKEAVEFVRARVHHKVFVVLDNCYGEFTERQRPLDTGLDMIIGSLIKNPGGGMADCGGYIAGTEEAVRLASFRLTCPGMGCELGASLGQNRNLIRGLFYAPHTVAQAMKTAHFAAFIFDALGYDVYPMPLERRADIIQTVTCGTPEGLVGFCRGIQSASPVDAYVSPEPWDMPGYADKVVMAAGTFVGGASIELSADGPLRAPYTAYLQGGLTFESARLGILSAAQQMTEAHGKR